MNRYKLKMMGVCLLFAAIFFVSLVFMLLVKVTIFIANLICTVFERVLIAVCKKINA